MALKPTISRMVSKAPTTSEPEEEGHKGEDEDLHGLTRQYTARTPAFRTRRRRCCQVPARLLLLMLKGVSWFSALPPPARTRASQARTEEFMNHRRAEMERRMQAARREATKVEMYGEGEIVIAKSKRFSTGHCSTIGKVRRLARAREREREAGGSVTLLAAAARARCSPHAGWSFAIAATRAPRAARGLRRPRAHAHARSRPRLVARPAALPQRRSMEDVITENGCLRGRDDEDFFGVYDGHGGKSVATCVGLPCRLVSSRVVCTDPRRTHPSVTRQEEGTQSDSRRSLSQRYDFECVCCAVLIAGTWACTYTRTWLRRSTLWRRKGSLARVSPPSALGH